MMKRIQANSSRAPHKDTLILFEFPITQRWTLKAGADLESLGSG
jgi:hypothetical protein